MHKKFKKKNQTLIKWHLIQVPTYWTFLIAKITNPIRKLIPQNIYLLKPFQVNVLKQNAENVQIDHFKIKRYK